MKKQGRIEKTEPIPQPPFITEAELGACFNCPGYQFLKPHQRQGDGTIKIRCFSAGGMVSVKADIDSYKECEVYKQDRRMM